MTRTLFSEVSPALLVFTLFVAMLAFNKIGYWIARWHPEKRATDTTDNLGSLEASILGLLGLLLAFTFGAASSRYDARRQVLIEEVNAIGTAVLRADLYPTDFRDAFRSDFQKYVNSRIRYFTAGSNETEIAASLKEASTISAHLWRRAADLAQKPENLARTNQMVPALNNMIDAVTTREATRTAGVPVLILFLLCLLCLVASFVVGYGRQGGRIDWIISSMFALMTVMGIYLILDLDHPRSGMITLEPIHQSMKDLRDQFTHR